MDTNRQTPFWWSLLILLAFCVQLFSRYVPEYQAWVAEETCEEASKVSESNTNENACAELPLVFSTMLPLSFSTWRNVAPYPQGYNRPLPAVEYRLPARHTRRFYLLFHNIRR